MSLSFKLHRLQQFDSQLDQIRTRLREIEEVLSDDSALIEAQQRENVSAAVLDASQKNLHKAEENVKALNLKIEQTEASLYGGKVRNPKELQDLQNESEALKRYLTVLNDRLLEAMIAQDEANTSHEVTLTQLERVKAGLAQQRNILLKEQHHLVQEVTLLESERGAAVKSISENELLIYEQLRKQKRGVAVANVKDKTCSACGTTLSAAQFHNARSPNTLTRCETCGRILYGG
jgi:predicted  nucleic acid-binding Zn-ribbon protein